MYTFYPITKLTPQQSDLFEDLIRLYAEVFEMKDFQWPDQSHFQKLLFQENFVVLVAWHENKVVGGLTAYLLPSYYSNSTEVYLYDLGVSKDYQRKGVGRALLEGLRSFCVENNFSEFFVQANIEDMHALEFYRATGGVGEKVIHYSYPVKK